MRPESNMSFPPDHLVAFHSHVATLYPGDIISTGTPGAVVIENGDSTDFLVQTRNNPRLSISHFS